MDGRTDRPTERPTNRPTDQTTIHRVRQTSSVTAHFSLPSSPSSYMSSSSPFRLRQASSLIPVSSVLVPQRFVRQAHQELQLRFVQFQKGTKKRCRSCMSRSTWPRKPRVHFFRSLPTSVEAVFSRRNALQSDVEELQGLRTQRLRYREDRKQDVRFRQLVWTTLLAYGKLFP